ncbi:aminoglycoside phosphotransferase family protein [Cellulomonas sp. NS3]|uniref:aminoglycoside phosphotransferase family protein n=1 Tax=Cellulomonas sp. NS3 TaxID=2973977 RepID=UPI00216361B4|nr:aminoglycoside phosphotransferase family protein [Cellulomonas sp. NS3]
MAAGRMHVDEVVVDAALVRRLVAEQHPRWADLPVVHASSAGTDNAMFRLGDDLAVRLPRIPWAADGVAHEQRWLPVIGPALPVETPVPLALGAPDHGYPWPWSVYTWLEGAPPGPADVTEQLVHDLAGCLAVLHALDVPGGPPNHRGLTLDARDAVTRESIAAMRGMPGIDTDAVTAVWDAAFDLPTCEPPGVWIHSDIAPGNLLVRGGRLTGLIDFAGVSRGDRAVDLQVAWNLLPRALRPVLREALDVDEATWLRSRAWSLSQACLQLPYYVGTNKPLAANARYVIGEVLADAAGR